MHIPLFSLLLLIPLSSAYVYPCLDACECDTTDEVIHCHNGERKTLALPDEGRLRGFHAIGMTFNKVEKLPSEDEIIDKFPDVLAIDVERNPDFDCSSLLEFTKVKVISDCYKNISDISQIPEMLRPSKVGVVWMNETADCDFECTAKKHYNDLHKYVMKLWEVIKEKYRTFDKDQALEQIKVWMADVVKTFFIETVQSINRKIDKSLDEFHPRNQQKTITAVSPAPTLEMVTSEDLD
ncbi:hypothetical protein PRIPAC_71817 [Pristionchus pacificus]|nr:hypothetical protein PRIPAC_71817 [Pristionchus pacificus]|eukprot:PDM75086.1 hypothetical protein PRIPAC_40467 [Pristionchus pacificus]